MKIIFRSTILTALLILGSCSKDSDETPIDQIDEQTEQLEQTPLEVNKVSDNLVIAGSTKQEGVPPSPTGVLSFNIASTSKTALLREGFDITLSHDTDIVGAYLLVKTEDGSTADGYFDVNIDANTSTSKSAVTTRKGKSISSSSKEENETKLDIDFTAKIEPGVFCYELHVYDSEGSISEPKEVCITVQSWGGKAEVVGKWELEKIEYQFTNGQFSNTVTPGVEDCDEEETYECANGSFEASDNCTIQEYYNLELKADGNYVLGHKDTESFLKEDESIEMCSAVYEDDFYGYDSMGKWAYDDKEDRIILIEYSGIELYDGETENYTNEPGEGEVYYGAEGDIKLENGFLVFPFETSTIYLKK